MQPHAVAATHIRRGAEPPLSTVSVSASILDRITSPLDLIRRTLLSAVMRVPVFAFVVARRDARVVARSVFGIVLALTLTVLAPAVLLIVSPIVFGVPHVGSDVRYLVRRQKMPRAVEASVYVVSALFLALRVAEMITPFALPYPQIELSAAAAWVVLMAMAAGSGATARARAAGIGLITLGLLAYAWPQATAARLVFAHLHNAVAIAVWLGLFFRGRRSALFPLVLIVAASTLLLSGATVPLTVTLHGDSAFGADLYRASDWLAPHLDGTLGIRMTLLYLFLQGLHYMAWLVWIPDSALRPQGTLTFGQTGRGLVRDFGSVGLGLLGLSALVLAVAACFHAERARTTYLSLAAFHGYLELAAVAYIATRAAPPPNGAS